MKPCQSCGGSGWDCGTQTSCGWCNGTGEE